MFETFPSSFVLTPAPDKHEITPLATGGFSEVYEATFGGRRVAIKTLNVDGANTVDGVRKAGDLSSLHHRGDSRLASSSLLKRLLGGSGFITRMSCRLLGFR